MQNFLGSILRNFPVLNHIIRRPEQVGDAALFVHGREGEFVIGKMRPIGARRKRTRRSLDRILIKPFRLQDKWQQFGQQHRRVFALKDINIARTDPVKLSDCHLALVRAALAEQHLSALEGVRNSVPSATRPQLRMRKFSCSMCSRPTKRSIPAASGSAVHFDRLSAARVEGRVMTSAKRVRVIGMQNVECGMLTWKAKISMMRV